MGKHVENDLTASIVSSVLSLYTNGGLNLFFRYDNKFMSMRSFLSLLVPSIDALKWPLDKTELPRVWHDVYVITDDMTGVSVDRVLPPATSSKPSEEVILHRRFLFDTLTQVTGRRLPNMHLQNVDPVTGIHRAPTSEIRVSTFQTSWFLSQDRYAKRFRLLQEASVTTLFIGRKIIWDGSTRYNFTWLPHVHLNPHELQKRRGTAWAATPCPSEKIITSTGSKTETAGGITVLVWNVQGSVNLLFAATFVKLIERQIPDMVILAGTDVLTDRARKITKGVGYSDATTLASDDGTKNGLFVFWNPKLVEVDDSVSYPGTKNLRIKQRRHCTSKTRGWTVRNFISKLHW